MIERVEAPYCRYLISRGVRPHLETRRTSESRAGAQSRQPARRRRDYGLAGQLDGLTRYGKPFWVTELAIGTTAMGSHKSTRSRSKPRKRPK
jgi:hypothetical protein